MDKLGNGIEGKSEMVSTKSLTITLTFVNKYFPESLHFFRLNYSESSYFLSNGMSPLPPDPHLQFVSKY